MVKLKLPLPSPESQHVAHFGCACPPAWQQLAWNCLGIVCEVTAGNGGWRRCCWASNQTLRTAWPVKVRESSKHCRALCPAFAMLLGPLKQCHSVNLHHKRV